jgi:DNA-directed RNA polymerase subunit RPC12/RpoP
MDFVIVCRHCWKGTKYDALSDARGLECDKCGAVL